jgi:hypothetical protein
MMRGMWEGKLLIKITKMFLQWFSNFLQNTKETQDTLKSCTAHSSVSRHNEESQGTLKNFRTN